MKKTHLVPVHFAVQSKMAANVKFQDSILSPSLEDINETLDELLLEFFEKLETLESLRNDLTSAMRHGFLSMSKARYSMGNKAVGEMQYARSMTASTFVVEEESCSNSKNDEKELNPDLSGFEVVFDGVKMENELCKEVENVTENKSSGLRQRGAGKNHQGKDTQELIESEIGISSRKKSTDPLKWFGVLVPTSLRDCQREFKTACCLSFEIAQLEQEVNTIMNDYLNLKEKKRIVQNLDEKKDK